MSNRERAESLALRISNDDNWADCTSEYVKRTLTEALDAAVADVQSQLTEEQTNRRVYATAHAEAKRIYELTVIERDRAREESIRSVAEKMEREYPLNKHAREWAGWIREEFLGEKLDENRDEDLLSINRLKAAEEVCIAMDNRDISTRDDVVDSLRRIWRMTR